MNSRQKNEYKIFKKISKKVLRILLIKAIFFNYKILATNLNSQSQNEKIDYKILF